jgi:FAD synthetase
VTDSIRRYNMKIVRLGGDMKEGLEKYLDGEGTEMQSIGNGDIPASSKNKRQVKAMFIGTRRTDPHGANLKPRDPTDEGWPQVERVQPILDWSYKEVWSFLRCPVFAVTEDKIEQTSEGIRWGEPYGIPYCKLYDEGYTSLGSTFNTFPNPVLDTRKGEPVNQDDKTNKRWQPAYMLEDGSLERAGRESK